MHPLIVHTVQGTRVTVLRKT